MGVRGSVLAQIRQSNSQRDSLDQTRIGARVTSGKNLRFTPVYAGQRINESASDFANSEIIRGNIFSCNILERPGGRWRFCPSCDTILRKDILDAKETLMLISTLYFQIALMIVIPIVLAIWLKRRLRLSWMLFFGGVLAFVAAWVVTNFIPLPDIGRVLLASVAQMGILYLVYRYQLKTVETEREALMVGAGQGGTELILLAIFFVALPLMQMMSLRDATDADLISLVARADDISEDSVEPSRIDEVREVIDDFWNTQWYIPLLQLVQSLALIPVQMALSVVVLGVLIHQHWRPLAGAIALHFLSRAFPLLVGGIFGSLLIWMILTWVFGGLALWFLVRLWPTAQDQTLVLVQSQVDSKSQ